MEYQDTRFFISNFECDNKIEALDFVNKVKAKVNSYLLIDSFSDEIDISVGATENLFFKRDTRNFFRILNNLTDFAKDNKQEILFFDESKKVANEESTFKTEVENIIDKGKLQFFYQPIYSFKYNRVTSYFSSIKPFDTVFESIDDLRKFAVRTDDDQELFNTIAKNAITQFVQEKGPLNVRLFFGLSINEFAYAASSLAHIPGIKDANVILYIDEREIENLSEKEEDSITNFINSIRTIKSNGYDVALIIENDILTLSPKIYGLFDYYIVKAKDYIANKKENRIPAFKALIENLIRYNKSIVAIDIPTWDAVDLVYKFGIENISGDPLAIKRENVVPLDKKTFLKIKKLKA